MKRIIFCLLLLAATFAANGLVTHAQAPPSLIRVCKAAAITDLVGVIYNFTVTIGNAAPVAIAIPAGTAVPPNCVDVGPAAVGALVSINEAVSLPQTVSAISVSSAGGANVTGLAGIFDPSLGLTGATFTVADPGGGTITVIFVNQQAPRNYQVNYVSGSGGTVRLLNPGVFRTATFDRAPVCANIYVYRPDEQLLACCSCPVTANGLRRLNVATNLLSNPLQPPLAPPNGVTQDAVIKIVPTRMTGPGSVACSTPPAPMPGTVVMPPTAAGFPAAAIAVDGLVSWATHVQGAAGTPAGVTETESQFAPLREGELSALQAQCAAASFLGTGAGICTCGPDPRSFFGPEEVP